MAISPSDPRETWDSIDIPPAWLLKKLGITSIAGVCEQIKLDVELLVKYQANRSAATELAAAPFCKSELAFCDLAKDPFDTLGRLLCSMRIQPVPCSEEELSDIEGNVLVNCVG